MKAAVFVALAISLSLSASAQVYQPRLDQDNTSATLADTMKFVLDTANDPSLTTGGVTQTEDTEGRSLQTFAASSPSSCSLSWSYLDVAYGFYNMGASTARSTYQIELSRIDLSSIKAAPTDNGGFGVQLAAMPGSSLGTDTVTHFDQDHGIAWFEHNKYWKSLDDAKTAPCNPKDKKCSVKQSNTSTAALFLNNQDSAQRVSRALLHAALLCGAKASTPPPAPSPF
jgi:hypothetical protein